MAAPIVARPVGPATKQRVPVFQDYLEFTLSYDEIQAMCMNSDAYQEWKARLSAVAGVYLIVATKTGEQYVGSAHGTEGIWGRWMAYARTGHGGNVLLEKLIAEDHDYPDGFVFSILQVLPKTQTRDGVLGWGSRYKAKLGTRATGLNLLRR